MKTCEGRISVGAGSTPIAKVTGYGYNLSYTTSSKTYLDNDCKETTSRQSSATQVTVEGDVINGSSGQDQLEALEGGVMQIFPEGETSGKPIWNFTGATLTGFQVTGGAGADVTFSATISAEAVDKTGLVA